VSAWRNNSFFAKWYKVGPFFDTFIAKNLGRGFR
jgi:hypothetical protein